MSDMGVVTKRSRQDSLDWTAIHLDWCAGILSASAILRRHPGLSHQALYSYVGRNQLKRSVVDSTVILQAMKDVEELSRPPDPSSPSDLITPEDIRREALALATGVLGAHRKDIARLRGMASLMSIKVQKFLVALEDPDEDSRNEQCKDAVMAFGGDTVMGTIESLSRVYKRITEMERESYGLAVSQTKVGELENASEAASRTKLRNMWKNLDDISNAKSAVTMIGGPSALPPLSDGNST